MQINNRKLRNDLVEYSNENLEKAFTEKKKQLKVIRVNVNSWI